MEIRVYNANTKEYYTKIIDDSEIVEVMEEPTEIELIQQNITDLELNDIEQGQMLTELELMILGGNE